MNFKTRIPNWVAERFTAKTFESGAGVRANAEFKVDEAAPEWARAAVDDYWESGMKTENT